MNGGMHLFTRTLHRLRFFRGPRHEKPSGDDVRGVISSLEVLNRSTEHDFLAIGRQLSDFQSRARRISLAMQSLTALVSGDQGRQAFHTLTGMIENATRMCAGAENSARALSSVRDLASRIRLSFSRLGDTVSIFRALCPLTRIETSRLGLAGEGVGDLADQVEPLSDSIAASGKGVTEASAGLERCIQSAIRQGVERSTRQVNEVRALIARVMESLEAFEKRQRSAREASVIHAARHAEICSAIEDLVRSIQFHDITRQQIEHVIHALAGMKGAPEATALRLQSSQLAAAGDSFAASIGHIQNDLGSIAGRVREQADAARTLMGFSESERDSFFSQMEAAFARIAEATHSCAAGDSAIATAASELDQTLAAMRASVHEIRSIEIQIQRVALNATIRSTHIGSPGDALSVIANVMHHVALDSNRNTEEVAGILDSIAESAAGISGKSAGELETDGMVQTLRGQISGLHVASQSSFSRVQEISALAAELGDALEQSRDQFRVGAAFADSVARTRAELDRISGLVAPGASADLERFARNYSMQAERDIHESVLHGETTAAPSELGDNVELF